MWLIILKSVHTYGAQNRFSSNKYIYVNIMAKHVSYNWFYLSIIFKNINLFKLFQLFLLFNKKFNSIIL